MPITPDNRTECPIIEDDTRKQSKMCESQSSVEELISLDDLEGELKKSTNKTVLSEQQKYADENLFLRYDNIKIHIFPLILNGRYFPTHLLLVL